MMLTRWDERPLGAEQWVAWLTFLTPLFVLGGALSLQALRETRTRWMLRDEDTIGRTAIALHTASTAIVVLTTASLLVLGLLPLFG